MLTKIAYTLYHNTSLFMTMMIVIIVRQHHRRRSRGGRAEGQLPPPPTCRQGGKRYQMPHFADLVEWCLQARKKNISIYRWKGVKYYQKCVKFACNYFKNSSTSGELRPQAPYRGSAPGPRWWFCPTPSQTFFRCLWIFLRVIHVLWVRHFDFIFYSWNVFVIVHVTNVLLIALFSRFDSVNIYLLTVSSTFRHCRKQLSTCNNIQQVCAAEMAVRYAALCACVIVIR